MSLLITAYFSDGGSPKTGLSPTIDIYDLSDNSLDIDGGAMTEVGGGFYKYTFTAHDNTKDYAIICDGTATLSGSERYAISTTGDAGDVNQILADTNELQGLISSSKIAAQVKGIDNIDLSATMKSSVNSEVDTALSDINLDHLMKVAVSDRTDMTTEIVNDTVLANIMVKAAGDTSDFDPTTDSLEAIRDQVTSEGPGSEEGTLTVKDDDGNALDNVRVWLTSDEAGNTVVGGVKTTNSSGQVTFMVDYDATYYVWREHSSYTFDNPQTWSPTE